ncbi:MAG: phage portal protein [Planctomycetaceae bacterium]|nr:phage portal protein [Planctomycetaceae bacterium]
MSFDFEIFADAGLSEEFVSWLIEEQWPLLSRQFDRLWEYYQNPRTEAGVNGDGISENGRGYVQAQEVGLPARITGRCYGGADAAGFGRSAGPIQRKEVVIENDIAWRVNAMVDFLFGRGIKFVSAAEGDSRRRDIESILKTVFEANGGAVFFQDLAVLGSVYGFVDCLVRWGGLPPADCSAVTSNGTSESTSKAALAASSFEEVLRAAEGVALELIEADRALPVLEEHDYKKIRYYVQHFVQARNEMAAEMGPSSLFGGRGADQRRMTAVTEVLGAGAWQRYEDGQLAAEGANLLGRVPVVHVQNLSQPGFYEGLSDVEQLIGLQDELNTRLSDRASRVTMQSFKMYLAKGIEGVGDKPVSPGRMWCTDNMDAAIEEFGGDGNSPSENMHIAEVREAMDKVSGVTPVVAGVLKNKLGNLSSAVALKMTFMGMLSKTYRKQLTYGQGIRQICAMVLETLDKAGVFKTSEREREVKVVFADPLQ